MGLRRVTAVATVGVVFGSLMSSAAPMRPERDSVVTQLERFGFSCGSDEFGGARCDWREYPRPSFTIVLVVDAGRVKSLAFWTIPVDEEPIREVPEPMSVSADLDFEGSKPIIVREWLDKCVGTVGAKPRPAPIRLGGGYYVCGGEPNAPGYSVHWK